MESSGCSESNCTRFYHLRSYFDLPRAGQTKFQTKKKQKNSKINVLANNFGTTKDRANRETPSYSFVKTRGNKHLDPEGLIWKFDLKVRSNNLTWWVTQMGHVAYQFVRLDKTNAVTSGPRLYLDYVRRYWPKCFRDLRWRHMTCTGVTA